MSTPKNFKEHWINFFSDEKRFKIDTEEVGDLEVLRVSSPNLLNQAIVEISIVSNDEIYLDMENIRFFHPLNTGFNFYQEENSEGFSDEEGEFEAKNIKTMEALINDYLEHGVSETIHVYNGSDFKSEITVFYDGVLTSILWHDKGHMMSSKIQRFLNKSFVKNRVVIGHAWA